MAEQSSESQIVHVSLGSLPLCLKAEDPGATAATRAFTGLPEKVRERLESFANVRMLGVSAEMDSCGVRLPRSWKPIGETDCLDAGPWAFSEFLSPVIFQFHLPSKLQENIFPAILPTILPKRRLEDFTVAYDGMIFICVADARGEYDWLSLGPAVRKYLQCELLKGIRNFTPAIIPPSPMHIQIQLIYEQLKENESGQVYRIRYDPDFHTLIWLSSGKRPGELLDLVGRLYYELRSPIHTFYHLQIDRGILDDMYRDILDGSQSAYDKYDELMRIGAWKPSTKLRLNKELSRIIAHLHQTFCRHSLALADLEKSRSEFLKKVSEDNVLRKAEDYFKSATRTDQVNYVVFESALEHMRSHLLVLAQNRYLMYAALMGSLITLLGTLVGFLLRR